MPEAGLIRMQRQAIGENQEMQEFLNFGVAQNSIMRTQTPEALYQLLSELGIPYTLHHHPPAPTIEIAREYWINIPTAHCRNIFFRNHKGNRHYLVIIEHLNSLPIHQLEKRLKQGKLTFASPERMMRYLGVTPGSVSPYGLINDVNHHVHLFIDETLRTADTISFHPLINTASLSTRFDDFIRFLDWTTNTYEFINFHNPD